MSFSEYPGSGISVSAMCHLWHKWHKWECGCISVESNSNDLSFCSWSKQMQFCDQNL